MCGESRTNLWLALVSTSYDFEMKPIESVSTIEHFAGIPLMVDNLDSSMTLVLGPSLMLPPMDCFDVLGDLN